MATKKVQLSNVILIGLGMLILGALAVSSVSCNQQARSIPPQESAIARQSVTPGQPQTRVPPASTATTDTSGAMVTPRASATVMPRTSSPANTPLPTPTPTKEEKLLVEMQHSDIQSATSPDECAKILETQPWCNVTKSVVRIVRPEWEQLLPRTEFYLGKYDLYGGEVTQQRIALIIEQDGQRYTVKTFDRLLETNGIATITDENRELVAKALVLVTLDNYLEEEITLSALRNADVQGGFSFEHYNYTITAWTKVQGLSIGYLFMFDQGRLRMVTGYVNAYNTGDYIDVPFREMPQPAYDAFTYSYWGR